MDKKTTEYLFNKYPKIFVGRRKSIKESLIPFGCECGNGWKWLIDNLCSQLQHDIDNNKYPQIEASQVKEKFGGLRFYVVSSTDKQQEIIDFAESLSLSICENCGDTKTAKIRGGGWVRTLCDNCHSKKER